MSSKYHYENVNAAFNYKYKIHPKKQHCICSYNSPIAQIIPSNSLTKISVIRANFNIEKLFKLIADYFNDRKQSQVCPSVVCLQQSYFILFADDTTSYHAEHSFEVIIDKMRGDNLKLLTQ